jgi:hypothetical protein
MTCKAQLVVSETDCILDTMEHALLGANDGSAASWSLRSRLGHFPKVQNKLSYRKVDRVEELVCLEAL